MKAKTPTSLDAAVTPKGFKNTGKVSAQSKKILQERQMMLRIKKKGLQRNYSK